MTTKQNILTLLGCFWAIFCLNVVLVFSQNPEAIPENTDYQLKGILENREDLRNKLTELEECQKTIQDKNTVAAIQTAQKEIENILRVIEQKYNKAQKFSKELETAQKNHKNDKKNAVALEKIENEVSELAIKGIEIANKLLLKGSANQQKSSLESNTTPQTIEVSIDNKQQLEIRASLNQLAWNLFSKSGTQPICPYSAAIILNMLREGADGDTAMEIEKFLGTKLKGNTYFAGMDIIANKMISPLRVYSMVMFGDNYKTNPQYEQFIAASEGVINDKVVIGKADFATQPIEEMAEMNKWFSDTTKGEIQKVFTKISPQTHAVFANVTLLDVHWVKHFIVGPKKDFHLKDGKTKKISMMTVSSNVMYGKDKDCEIVVLPYRNKMAMVIVLPKDVKTLEQIQTQKNIDWFINSVKQTDWKYGMVTMPPFKAVGNIDLIPLFKQLGLKTTFSPDANFSKIIGNDLLIVDQFLQDVVINVNKDGTKATAATAATMIPRGPERHADFQIEINRPFIYAIVDNLDAINDLMILYIGVMDGSNVEVEHE